MRLRTAVAATVVAALAVPGQAAAIGFEALYRDFKDDGAIDSCRWSDSELRSAERDIPADVEQYAPAFGDQIAVARQRHARGECEPGGEAAGPGLAGVPAAPAAEIPADTGVDVPLAVSLLGWLVIVAAVVAAIALTASRSERFRDLAREFWDWLRLGH